METKRDDVSAAPERRAQLLAKVRVGNRGPGQQPARRFALLAFIAMMLAYTVWLGMSAGWSSWLPGSMSRHRDAEAVAITAVAYGHWQGYAAYRDVNRVLRQYGLSVHQEDLARVGAKHYFEVMMDPQRLEAGLNAASALAAPASGGMYYSQDEKGMAAFFIAAFKIFGISPTSWFWLYITLYTLSVATLSVAFRARVDALFLSLVLVSAHAIAAKIIPEITLHDVSVIQGNRFLGIMGSVAMCHLMLLILLRTRPSIGQVAGAAIQAALISLAIYARTSTAWLLIGLMALWAGLWLVATLRRWWSEESSRLESRPMFWPIAVAVVGLAALFLQDRYVQDTAYRDGRAHGAHVFWHNLTTALHNNPSRTVRYAIPADYPVHDDRVTYLLFDREIVRRGADRSRYLVGDADWIYRTTSPELDFRWEAYDSVVREIFLRTVGSDPLYAMYSFLVQQPVSALRITFGRDFLLSSKVLDSVSLIILAIAALLAGSSILRASKAYFIVLATISLSVVVPVVLAAVIELRVVELFYVLLVDTAIAATLILAWVERTLAASATRRTTP
jgi:hypothetical protein